jgi:3-oxoadipate enol-lactonase/4-carboxymuconolactone decarboxylase
MPFANNGQVRLYWRQDGSDSKPPLLLLHPILMDHAVWDRVVPFLIDHFRIIRMDLRGHGASSATGNDFSLTELAADAWSVLGAAGSVRTLVCGLSLGGLIALQMASSQPQRLTGIAVASCAITADRGLWNDRIAEAQKLGLNRLVSAALDSWIDPDVKTSSAVWSDPIHRAMLATSVDGYCGCANAIRTMDLESAVRGITVPTLVLSGTIDRGTPYAPEGHRIADLVPGALECLVPGGFLACLENPGAFVTSLGRFFDRLRPGGVGLDPARNGERVRREVLGDAWVDRSIANRDGWIADYQDYATEVAWHTIWGREGLDYRTRRLLVLGVTAALGRWEEFRLHVRSGIERGSLTVQDVKEVCLHAGLYAGVPVANTAFAECAALFRDMGIPARATRESSPDVTARTQDAAPRNSRAVAPEYRRAAP